MSSRLRDTDRGYRAFAESLRALAAQGVELAVGLPKERTPADLIAIAAYNENGTATIPARPFLRTTLDRNGSRYSRRISDALGAAIDGWRSGRDTLPAEMERLGREIVTDIQGTIQNGMRPANAASTLRRKQDDRPLIRTGRLLRGITYIVRRRP